MVTCICNPRLGAACVCTDNFEEIAIDAITILMALKQYSLATTLSKRLVAHQKFIYGDV